MPSKKSITLTGNREGDREFYSCAVRIKNVDRNGRVRLFRFPQHDKLRELWIRNIGRPHWQPMESSRICSKHFEPDLRDDSGFRSILSPSAIPTIFDRVKPKKPTIKKSKIMKHHSLPEKPKKSKKTSKQHKLEPDPLKEYAYDSTDKESPDTKEEEDSDDDVEIKDTATNTDKVFVKSITCKGKEFKDGQCRLKRSRKDVDEDQDEYAEQLYEFGKYVAEQLLCLDVEDAQVAREDIVAVLSKFAHKNVQGEPSTSKAEKNNFTVGTKDKMSGPAVSSVISLSEVNVGTQPQYFLVNTQSSRPDIPRVAVGQTSQVNVPESSMKRTTKLIVRKSQAPPAVTAKPILTQVAVVKNQDSLPRIPLSYVIVPQRPKFIIAQHGKTIRTLVTQRVSSIANRSFVNQTSSNVVPPESPVIQPVSSSINFSDISVKTEPESESICNHVNVFRDERTESVVKNEPESGDET